LLKAYCRALALAARLATTVLADDSADPKDISAYTNLLRALASAVPPQCRAALWAHIGCLITRYIYLFFVRKSCTTITASTAYRPR
jgi:hypothetical protein